MSLDEEFEKCLQKLEAERQLEEMKQRMEQLHGGKYYGSIDFSNNDIDTHAPYSDSTAYVPGKALSVFDLEIDVSCFLCGNKISPERYRIWNALEFHMVNKCCGRKETLEITEEAAHTGRYPKTWAAFLSTKLRFE